MRAELRGNFKAVYESWRQKDGPEVYPLNRGPPVVSNFDSSFVEVSKAGADHHPPHQSSHLSC